MCSSAESLKGKPCTIMDTIMNTTPNIITRIIMPAIADITGVCLAMCKLNPEQIIVSPIHVGCGSVRCAHGILPVPAPATSYILRDVPIYGGKVDGELCTPTGASLLKTFADKFGEMPVMTVSKIGYGMGTKDFETANCLRVMLGETAGASEEQISELCCNISMNEVLPGKDLKS